MRHPGRAQGRGGLPAPSAPDLPASASRAMLDDAEARAAADHVGARRRCRTPCGRRQERPAAAPRRARTAARRRTAPARPGGPAADPRTPGLRHLHLRLHRPPEGRGRRPPQRGQPCRSHAPDLIGPAAPYGRAAAGRHAWSFAFDASWQPLLWLLDGTRCTSSRRDPPRPGRLAGYRATHGSTSSRSRRPSWPQLVAAGLTGRPHGCARARRRRRGGAGRAVARAGRAAATEAYNLYGPTEATVDAAALRPATGDQRPAADRPPGRATRARYVLDARAAPGAAGRRRRAVPRRRRPGPRLPAAGPG